MAEEGPAPGVEIAFEIDGRRLTARASAAAPAGRPKLLIVPGAYGEAARLAPSIDRAFGDSFDWLCPDMPASREDADFGDPGIENVASLFGRMAARRFGGAPYGILGTSMGGIVGARIARVNPAAVRALALDDPPLRSAQQSAIRELVADLYRRMPDGAWRARFDDYARACLGFDPARGAFEPRDHAPEFEDLPAPVLVVAGDRPRGPGDRAGGGPACFDADSEAALRRARGAGFLSILRLAGLGHSLLLLTPELCAPYFADFFGKHLSGTAAPDETALAARGLEHAKAGRAAEAYREFLRIHALRPDDPAAAWFAGAVALQAGDPRAALGPLARACMAPNADESAIRSLETAMRAAPEGTYDAYRHVLRAAVSAHRADGPLYRAYVAAFPPGADPLGEAAFHESMDGPDLAPATRSHASFARVLALRSLGLNEAAYDVARASRELWNSPIGELAALQCEIYSDRTDDAQAAGAVSAYYRAIEAHGAERRAPRTRRPGRARPRVGFMSACFDQVSYLPQCFPLFAEFDYDGFEVSILPLGGTGVLPSQVRAMPPGAVRPVPVLGFDNDKDPAAYRAAADFIAGLDLDALIDMDDVLGPFSARLMMLRPAPLQGTWLNNVSACADPSTDFTLAQRCLFPDALDAQTARRLLALPDDAFICDPSCVDPGPPDTTAGPAERGEGVVFGSLSQRYKIGAATFALWAKVMRAVPEARFRLANRDVAAPSIAAHARAEFARHGVDPSRIDFAVAAGYPGYLEAYRDIDVVLGTYPVPGGATAIQAIWQGVPVVARGFPSPLGRTARWLEAATGRPGTAHDDDDSFVAAAAALARDREGLAAFRRSARARLGAKGRADAPRFARAFEAALRAALAHG